VERHESSPEWFVLKGSLHWKAEEPCSRRKSKVVTTEEETNLELAIKEDLGRGKKKETHEDLL